jgi:hypothetical protein
MAAGWPGGALGSRVWIIVFRSARLDLQEALRQLKHRKELLDRALAQLEELRKTREAYGGASGNQSRKSTGSKAGQKPPKG